MGGGEGWVGVRGGVVAPQVNTRGPELPTDGPDHTTRPKEHQIEFQVDNIQLVRSTGAKVSVIVLQGRKSSPQKSRRFNDYLLGTTFHINTDHKPLVPLLSTKNLDELPTRVQRFKMRLMRYWFTISYVAGKNLVTTDTLSRAPVSTSNTQDEECYQEVEAYGNFVCQNLPASDKCIEQIKEYQSKDEICQQLVEYCKNCWPRKGEIPHILKPYFSVSGEITMKTLFFCFRRNHDAKWTIDERQPNYHTTTITSKHPRNLTHWSLRHF